MCLKTLHVAVVSVSLFVLIGTAAADTVHLKNGTVLDGKITVETKKYVVIKVGTTGQMRIKRSRIKSIERVGAPKDDTQASPLLAAAPDKPDPNWRYRHASRFDLPMTEPVRRHLRKISTPGAERVDSVIALRGYGAQAVPAIPELLRIIADDRPASATDTSQRWVGYGALSGQSGYASTTVILAKEAAYTLAKLGEPAVKPTLDVLQDAHPTRRAYAAMSLSWNSAVRNHRREVERALKARLKDPTPKVRGQAVYTLALTGAPEGLDDVVPMLLDDDSFVRRRALAGLESRGISSELRLQPLLSGIRSSDASTRRHAARALASLASKIDDTRVTAALRRAARDPDAQVRQSVATALGTVTGGGETHTLVRATDDAEAKVRLEAVKALHGATESSAIRALVEALEDPSPDVRAAAASGLRGTDDARAIAALKRTLRDTNSGVARSAAYALAATGDASVIGLLFDLAVRDPHSAQKVEKAISGLARRSGSQRPKVVRFLVEKLKDRNQDVRLRAASALRNVRDPLALEPLGTATRDRHVFVRSAAAEALGLMRDARAIPYLIVLLEDSDDGVRKKAYEMLRLVSGQRDLPAERDAWQQYWEGQSKRRSSAPQASDNRGRAPGSRSRHRHAPRPVHRDQRERIRR